MLVTVTDNIYRPAKTDSVHIQHTLSLRRETITKPAIISTTVFVYYTSGVLKYLKISVIVIAHTAVSSKTSS